MHVWSIAFGCIIGWGSFVNPGKKFLPNSGVAGTAIAMVLGALVMIIIAFSYAYMVPKYPKAGGEFTFTKACYGKIPAYVCGWFLVAAYLTNVPMNFTAIPLIIEGLFGDVLNWGGIGYTIADSHVSLGGIVIASAILILFGILNIVGVKKAGIVQTILAALLATCAVTLCVAGLASGKASGANFSPIWGYDKKALAASGVYSESMANQNKLSAVLATFAIAPWAFVGFDTIPQVSEEFKFSYKKVIGIMVIAIMFGCFVYISNNMVAAAAIKNWPEQCAQGKWVLLVAAENLLGPFGKVLVGVGVSCAVLSGIMGFISLPAGLCIPCRKTDICPRCSAK